MFFITYFTKLVEIEINSFFKINILAVQIILGHIRKQTYEFSQAL